MIPVEQTVAKIAQRYPTLERVRDAVFRGVDLYKGRPYAVRYFDLTDDLLSAAANLREYQDKLLGVSYFDSESKADLRWNHYLYFVSSGTPKTSDAFLKAKATVEADREYARKVVITEADLDSILAEHIFGVDSSEGLPPDPLSIWTSILEQHDLGFIVDESQQVPAIVRDIADGERKPVLRPPTRPELDGAEKNVSNKFLSSIAIREFRKFPLQKTFSFGTVNLILGVNGVGKTSLLEAIEYLFCGKTRRAGTVPPRTSVSGTLADSQLTLQTRTTTSSATLRARHLAWYGKSELRTLTLDDSFSKFNFLDTDAAVRLSVEKSREQITEDLAQLLLGAESAKALDRFERVAKQLEESKKALENSIAVKDSRRADSVARIQQLRDTPQQSDQLFSDLLLTLRNFGWSQQPATKIQTDELSASIQTALVNVDVLKSGGDALPVNSDDLDESIRTLSEGAQRIHELTTQSASRDADSAQARLRLQALTRRMAALDALTPILDAGVDKLHQKSESLERLIAERTSALTNAEAAAAGLPPDSASRSMMLSSAASELTDQVKAAEVRADAARKALAALERTQNVLNSLRQRLRSTAREILQHSGDHTHCPLCRAKYSELTLARRIDEAASGVITSESDNLRSELRVAEDLHQQRVSELAALRALEQFTEEDPTKISVEEIIRSVTRDRERIAMMISELETTRTTLLTYEREGWTYERLIELSSTLGIRESDSSAAQVESLRAQIQNEHKQLTENLRTLEATAEASQALLATIAAGFHVADVNAAELLRIVSERLRTAEDLRRAIVALGRQVDLGRLRSASELGANLREARDLTVRLRTSLAQEVQTSLAIAQESKVVEDAGAEIDGLRVKLRRIDSADAVLRDLLAQQSEQLLTEEVLRENADKIASTFAKIHAPNEFDLAVNGRLTITRRGGGNVDLHEMSSGQRAAYALSLFLAMNERLRAGPRVLLFDDPVAHVDDINTLSLLDHLRDIALSGQRQIFFATADSKIGALFGRKFRFLGDQFKQIELTRS